MQQTRRIFRTINPKFIRAILLSIWLLALLSVIFTTEQVAYGQGAGETGVVAEAISTAIVRYGPGTDFPRVGRITPGMKYPVLRRHTRFEWVEIAYPAVASRRGWVHQRTVTISGDLSVVPPTSGTDFGYPTLMPTPLMVVTAMPPWTATPVAGPNEVLDKLGNDIYEYLVQKKFEPGTERQGAVAIMNLRTGHMFSVNPKVAFSGASLTKIPVMVALYRKLGEPPTAQQARLIASMMVCSENSAANAVLQFLGDGDERRGIDYVMETARALGMKYTILARMFLTGARDKAADASSGVIQTGIDQHGAQPDPFNQTTPTDIGWLMAGVYRCALDGGGPLTSAYRDELTETECRQMVNVMRGDRDTIMIAAGVPQAENIRVAHKRGWVDDTHGDAAIVTTPGGDYVLVVMLHAEKYLGFEVSFPVIGEISQKTYNVFNPARVLDKIRTQPLQPCALGSELLTTLQGFDPPPIR